LTGAALDALAGDYEAVAEAARESIKVQNEAAMRQAQIDTRAQEDAIRTNVTGGNDDMSYKTNGSITGNSYNDSDDDDDFSNFDNGEEAWITRYNKEWQAMGYRGGTEGHGGNDDLQFTYLDLGTSTSNMRSSGDAWVNDSNQNLWTIMEQSGFDKYLASTYGDVNGHLLVSKNDTFEYRYNMFKDLENLLYGDFQQMWAGLEDTTMYKRLVDYYNSIKEQFTAYDNLT
jgi:hypothetical protein